MRRAIVNASEVGVLSKGLVDQMYKAMDKFKADSCVVTLVVDNYAEVDLWQGKECIKPGFVVLAEKEG